MSWAAAAIPDSNSSGWEEEITLIKNLTFVIVLKLWVLNAHMSQQNTTWPVVGKTKEWQLIYEINWRITVSPVV